MPVVPGAWPAPAGRPDAAAAEGSAAVRGLVREVNRFRSQLRIPPSRRFPLVVTADAAVAGVIARHADLVASLACLSDVEVADHLDETPGTSTIPFPGGRAQVALAGVIDVAAELDRLARERDRMLAEAARVAERLDNPSFVDRAPADGVARERAKHDEALRVAEDLAARAAALGGADA